MSALKGKSQAIRSKSKPRGPKGKVKPRILSKKTLPKKRFSAPRKTSLGNAQRYSALLIVFMLIFAGIAFRLFQVQVLNYSRYQAYALAELTHSIALPAPRGTIYDRNGNILAISVPMPSIVADPYQIKRPLEEAKILSPVLGIALSQLTSDLSLKAGFVYLKRLVPESLAKKVMALNQPGIATIEESKRIYPDPVVSYSFLGSVNSYGAAISGLELKYNKLLQGKQGLAVVEKAPDGTDLPGTYKVIRQAKPGNSITFTIDSSFQLQAETDLAQEILSTNATKGMASFEDPKTGQILAMVSVQSYSGAPPEQVKDLVLAESNGRYVLPAPVNLPTFDVFEPGSVMKIATMAALLNQNLATPDTTFNIPPSITVGGYTFQDAEAHGNETLNLSQILAYSSNLGTIEATQILGAQGLYNSLRNLGFGQLTPLNYPGESPGLLPPISTWSASTIGSMPIGQAEGVTQLQLLNAYASIANWGVMMKPTLLYSVEKNDSSLDIEKPLELRKVISREADKKLISMFVQVVNYGTGTAAAVPGYVVAGKTGSANIPKHGVYLADQFYATFVGFLPAQNPAIVGVVTVDRPDNFYGGAAAAPVFSKLMQYAINHFNIAPSGT